MLHHSTKCLYLYLWFNFIIKDTSAWNSLYSNNFVKGENISGKNYFGQKQATNIYDAQS